MKKQFFVLLGMLMVIVISSCDKELVKNDAKIDRSDHAAFIKNLEKEIKESGKKYTVEHATLDEINAAMRANGLPEFSIEDVENAKLKTRDTYLCATWVALGDWNEDSSLNTIDLTLAQQWLCYTLGNCEGSVNILTCTDPCPTGPGTNFAWLSGLASDEGWDDFNPDDLDAGRDRILGIIGCN